MAALSRRDLLASIGAAWLLDAARPSERPFGGSIVGANHRVGHLLRDGAEVALDRPVETCDVVVIGSGVSGASAAWRLAASGVEVRMLDLEPHGGGTSTWGEDGVVSYPWGAHYLPVPNLEARATLRLLEELDAVAHWGADGLPRFREELLCHAPDERLFYRGAWHRGLIPASGLDAREREELARFGDLRARLRAKVGSDGRPAFSLPVATSSRDPELLALDRISMSAWLAREGFHAPFLRWLVEYATLDDFGAALDDVSAWAGLHYFCARKLETEQLRGSHYLVWPEGNGHLVRYLLERLQGRREQRILVTRVTPSNGRVEIDGLDVGSDRPVRRKWVARAAILAIPAFVAARLLPPPIAERLVIRTSSPWVVANVHVDGMWEPDRAWDSVIHGSPCLGYVDAGHQRTKPNPRTVLTYFRAFGGADVNAARARLVDRRWSEFTADVLLDLAPAHPDLAASIRRLDVMVWGHAMPRPRPGFLEQGRRSALEPTTLIDDAIAWAHVDRTGIALFEEANAHGVRAAEAISARLGTAPSESWL